MIFFKKSPAAASEVFLIIGLGNPGAKYAGNRHNIGFMAADAIADHHRFGSFGKRFRGEMAEGTLEGSKAFLLKPQTYMNLSGESAREMARFYKIPLSRIIAIHDELDLPLGKLRVKRGGGHGGHNGLKSLDAHLGQDYLRVRLGIGHPGDKNLVSNYVLDDFSKQEKPIAARMAEETARHIGLLLKGDEAGFMNKIALAMQDKA